MSVKDSFGLNVQMHFFLKATDENATNLQSIVSKNMGRPGVEYHCRAVIEKPDEIQEYIREQLSNKSFGNDASYFCDVTIKPDLLAGLKAPFQKLSIQTWNISNQLFIY